MFENEMFVSWLFNMPRLLCNYVSVGNKFHATELFNRMLPLFLMLLYMHFLRKNRSLFSYQPVPVLYNGMRFLMFNKFVYQSLTADFDFSFAFA